jgi:hypothetical protein
MQELIGIIYGTIRIDVSGGGGRYAGHSSLREIPNTLLIAYESRTACPLSLSKRESDHFIRPGKPRCVPTAVELLGYVDSSHVAGLLPPRHCSTDFHIHFCRTINNMVIGSGSLRRVMHWCSLWIVVHSVRGALSDQFGTRASASDPRSVLWYSKLLSNH